MGYNVNPLGKCFPTIYSNKNSDKQTKRQGHYNLYGLKGGRTRKWCTVVFCRNLSHINNFRWDRSFNRYNLHFANFPTVYDMQKSNRWMKSYDLGKFDYAQRCPVHGDGCMVQGAQSMVTVHGVGPHLMPVFCGKIHILEQNLSKICFQREETPKSLNRGPYPLI